MKLNKKIVFLVMFCFFTGITQGVAMVEPNQYKEKEVKIKTNHFHEKQLLEQKQTLPEEQKVLTFTRKQTEFYNDVKNVVFLSQDKENNTVIAKSTQMKLFSNNEQSYSKRMEAEKTNSIWDVSLILIVLITLAVLCMFVFIIPRLAKSESTS